MRLNLVSLVRFGDLQVSNLFYISPGFETADRWEMDKRSSERNPACSENIFCFRRQQVDVCFN